MAHRAGKATTKLGRDSKPKYLGIKLFGGQKVKPGSIIVRQRGTKYLPGKNVRRAGDDTLYATSAGILTFHSTKKVKFDGSRRTVKIISVK